MARQVLEYNAANKSGLHACSPGDVASVKGILEHSALRTPVNRVDEMNGIAEGAPRGLIRQMWLDRLEGRSHDVYLEQEHDLIGGEQAPLERRHLADGLPGTARE